jgi:CRP-like cAMP-binding protein
MQAPQSVRVTSADLFGGCTKAELRQLNSLSTLIRVPKDRVLMREGSWAREFMVICSGKAKVTRQTETGTTELGEVGSGEFLGEMGLLTGQPRSATAIAMTDLTLLVSTAGEFRSMLEVAPSVAAKIVKASEERAAVRDIAA